MAHFGEAGFCASLRDHARRGCRVLAGEKGGCGRLTFKNVRSRDPASLCSILDLSPLYCPPCGDASLVSHSRPGFWPQLRDTSHAQPLYALPSAGLVAQPMQALLSGRSQLEAVDQKIGGHGRCGMSFGYVYISKSRRPARAFNWDSRKAPIQELWKKLADSTVAEERMKERQCGIASWFRLENDTYVTSRSSFISDLSPLEATAYNGRRRIRRNRLGFDDYYKKFPPCNKGCSDGNSNASFTDVDLPNVLYQPSLGAPNPP
ncbi:uncharacterized protein LACBIDRAFT_328284 [Laccaria bicolor S238N-H82]|uniref:Predicted protein n=1 Tax=Laccaria bicolor (strain S238N-H82 / ATCC MYA-4686) TaxID=486041 RepID=B0DEE5_LACBS|nr:uncharacterized protein LACBIDRAFT_328284 [Laccaria bicolor S238N-H82]EDR06918.1 predicted protein [Laccaria bicolor S238N-H82]|eukprot:XP_001882291.1 predicted protein [Laccaria bicolor S238N-H82]